METPCRRSVPSRCLIVRSTASVQTQAELLAKPTNKLSKMSFCGSKCWQENATTGNFIPGRMGLFRGEVPFHGQTDRGASLSLPTQIPFTEDHTLLE